METQSQEGVLIWVNLNTEASDKDVSAGSRNPGNWSKRGMKVRQEGRKASEGHLMSRLHWGQPEPHCLGVSVKNHIEGASELAQQKMGIYLWCSHCLSVTPRGLTSPQICAWAVTLENAPRKQSWHHTTASLTWTPGSAESGGPRGWDSDHDLHGGSEANWFLKDK